MQNTTAVGISIPKKIMKEIDGNRGDIPRSKYIIRIIQGRLANLNTGAAEQVAVPTALDVHKSTQPLLSDTNFKEEDYDIG